MLNNAFSNVRILPSNQDGIVFTLAWKADFALLCFYWKNKRTKLGLVCI